MEITLPAELENALSHQALRRGIRPETLVLELLQERFLAARRQASFAEWEARLRAIGIDCGVSLSNDAVSSEGIYD